MAGVMTAQPVACAVVGFNLKKLRIRRPPLTDYAPELDPTLVQAYPQRTLVGSIAAVALDLD